LFVILWGTALFRLLVPVHIPVPFRFPSFPAHPQPAIHTGQPMAGNRPPAAQPVWEWSENLPNTAFSPQVNETLSIPPIIVLWLVGMVTLLIFFGVVYVQNHRKLRFATPVCNNCCINRWLAQHKLLRTIAIMQLSGIKTPLTLGVLRPQIILPSTLNIHDERLLIHILTHEYYHIKRFDALWKMFLVCALCIHWFNPLVWVMFFFANRDLEVACDALVVRRLGFDVRHEYAFSIIGMAEQAKLAQLHVAFSKNVATRQLKERIELIMKTRKTSRRGFVVAIVLALVLPLSTLAVFANNEHSIVAPATCCHTPSTEETAKTFGLENFRVEHFVGGYSIYNADDLIAPCGTSITSEEFLAAQRAHDASGGEYWPEVFRLLFDHGLDQPTWECAIDWDYAGGYTIQVEWMFSELEPTITVFAPNGDEVCWQDADASLYLPILVEEAVELAAANPVLETLSLEADAHGINAFSSCTHSSAWEQVVNSSTSSTSSRCWVQTIHYTLFCGPCHRIVGSGSRTINGPSHNFQRNPQGMMVCTSCFWVQ